MSKSCNGKVNKTRYDDPGKPIKKTSFTVKNLGGNLPEKQFTIVKRSFRSSTKPLSLESTIPIDELTAETFYRFRTSELFNIWMSPFWYTNPSTWLTPLHESQYVTHSPIWGRRILEEEEFWLQSSSLRQQWKSRSTWLQNLKAQRCSGFFQRE